jgi:5-(carboxyamino)imidazole ribonucleotide synthase
MTGESNIYQRIGVLGGGQLGKMLYYPASKLDLSIHFMDADPECPCAHGTPSWVKGSITSAEDVLTFGSDKDILTIEIEHVDTLALAKLEKLGKKVFPQPHIIETIQDKRLQKAFYREHGFPTAPFVWIENREDVGQKEDFLPAFNKIGRGGYDGKGVQYIASKEDIPKVFDSQGLLEKAVPILKELSVVVARSSSGECKVYPVVELVFDPTYHLVDYLLAPARISPEIASEATQIALALANKLGIVGLLAVELFLTKDHSLLVNEMAPRTHNSGHHTIEACDTSQFEQQLRAIMGMPLGCTKLRRPAAMINLVGSAGQEGVPHFPGMTTMMHHEGVFVHLYGKKTTKPGRKMGHVTILADTMEELLEKIRHIRPYTTVTTR